ncbi:MAG: amidase [Chloroflexota bacterium]
MVAVAHANDGLGSIRIPAGCCGLVGLKPSRGRVSPGPSRPAGLLENITEFVVTRSVRDSAAILDAVAGPMPGDRFVVERPKRPFLSFTNATNADYPPLKIGLMTNHDPFFPIPMHPNIVAAVEHTGRLLAAVGHHVEYAYPTQFHGVTGLGWALHVVLSSGAAATLDSWAAKTGKPITQADVEVSTWAAAELGRTFTAVEIHKAYQQLASGAAGVLKWWHEDGFDLLITPLMAQPTVPVGEKQFEAIRDAFGIFAMEFSITGQPAISVPALWTNDQMPVGVQIIADIGREDLLLRIASLLEQTNPWMQHWPTPAERL